MPSLIRVLDDHTINQIAAGEVVENPASVVKELVENSLDAGADEICVEIRGGGRQLIRITDNGSGMSGDDALLSLERHATSKIRALEDIFDSGTMGFRGEAVPSIAAISKMSLFTADRDGEGTRIEVEGGKILRCGPAPRSRGTTFEVASLFYNVPVRKKFQRSPAYDANEIVKVLTAQALAYPEVSFELINNQAKELVVKSSRGEDFVDKLGCRVRELFGEDFFGSLTPLRFEEAGCKAEGYIGLPAFHRQNRTGQHLLINRRAVFCPMISYAVKEGYGPTIPANRHPVWIVHLTLPPQGVDVNVHPRKKEVRLTDQSALKKVIFHAVDHALRSEGVEFHPIPSPAFEPQAVFSGFSYEPKEEQVPIAAEKPEPFVAAPASVMEERKPKASTFFDAMPAPSPFTLIGTIRGHLLAEGEEGELTIIDQQAAHSRILYEAMEKEEGVSEEQPLLIPYQFDLSYEDAELVREHMEDLQAAGLRIEPFGPGGFVLQAVPSLFSSRQPQGLIEEIVESLRESQQIPILKQEKKKRAAAAAGRCAVRRNQRLSLDEGRGLLTQLVKCKQMNHCPAGRPIRIEVSQEELAKRFQR